MVFALIDWAIFQQIQSYTCIYVQLIIEILGLMKTDREALYKLTLYGV